MSGVLERMAKRALGALPSVQPLASPQFATPAVGLRESMAELETDLEIEGPVRSATQKTENLSPERSAGSRRKREKPGPLPTPEFSPQPARTEARNRQTRIQSSNRKSEELTPQPGPESRLGLSNEPSLKTPEIEPGDTSFVPPMEYTARGPGEDANVKTGAPPATEIEERIVLHDRSEIPVRERQDHPISAARERNRQATPRALPGQAAIPVEQKTEINISIGSIEVRAPRVDARPQAPPFRPRVSLDDFLHRKPEGGL
jgi:hypothetical protein